MSVLTTWRPVAQNVPMKKYISLATSLLFIISLTLSGTAAAAPASVRHGVRLHNSHLRNGTSTNWSGYAVASSLAAPAVGAVSDVSGSWVVPTVVCTNRSSNYSSNWVGIDGYSDNTVEQTGTEHDCYRGRAQYYAWFEFYPQAESYISSMVVHPGDTMNGEVKYVGNSSYTTTISDQTTGQSYSTTRRMNAARESAEWITEAPSSWFGVLPLANFGTTGFTNASATLSGHTGSITDPAWANDPLTMVTNGGQPKAVLSNLSTDGTSFNVTWKHN